MTTPSKLATAAWTFITLAVTSTLRLAVILTLPAASMVMVHPLECVSLTSCAASSITSLCPLCMESVTFAAPALSSNSSRLPERVRISRLSLGSAGSSGSASRPFQAEPTM